MPATAIKERPILFNAEMVRAILDGRKSQTRRVVNPQPERWIDKYVPSASPEHWLPQGVYISDPAGALGRGPIEVRSNAPPVRCPYGKPGDRLYAQESWRVGAWNEDRGEIAVDYRADGHCRREWIEIPDPDAFVRLWQQSTDDAMRAGRQTDAYGRYNWDVGDAPTRWRPGRFMFRCLSRITLEITEVRAQRVQEISEGDAKAEGCGLGCTVKSEQFGRYMSAGQYAFAELWDSINAKPKPMRQDGAITHYVSFPWSGKSGTFKHMGKPHCVYANPWVWCIGFRKLERAG
jgi:hypothetical protein